MSTDRVPRRPGLNKEAVSHKQDKITTTKKIFKKFIYLINVKSIDNFEFMVHFELRTSLHKHKHIRQMLLNEISNSNFPRIADTGNIVTMSIFKMVIEREEAGLNTY